MKLVTFEINGRSAVGLLNADATAVHPVPGCADMQTLIGLWPALDTAAVLRSTAPDPPPGAGRDLPGHQLF